MTTYERQKLSNISIRWFHSSNGKQKKLYIAFYEAAVSTNTKKLSWQYLQNYTVLLSFRVRYWYTATNDRKLSLFAYNMQLCIQRL